MKVNTATALHTIAHLQADKGYQQVTKSDLFEALKYARHVAKCALAGEPEREEASA